MNPILRRVCLTAAAAGVLGGTVLGGIANAESITTAPASHGLVRDSPSPATKQDLAVAHQIERARSAQGVTRVAGGYNRCPNGYLCLFDGFGGQGAMAYFKWGSPNLAAQGFDNRTSSLWSRTSGFWNLYDLPNYRNHLSGISGGPWNENSFCNNKTSSVRHA